ncbi:polysaccharide deacetylase family protein [Arthrobacter sp. Soil763]|uniref:polysaccharide deacetylase family protein n=1 Tax=Arthrobacter sp. Soil763 TaxID=1736402 RepID=UPI0006FF9759|nr:polysaccharide deacetylase family protein [Arthrobacter sp. Soil763]KRE81746.1 polysaccharide deacetylase [Arthrobacter sp. Soil763]
MWSTLAADRRRLIALAAAALLIVGIVVAAVVLGAGPPASAPQTPAASSATATPAATPTASPSTARATPSPTPTTPSPTPTPTPPAPPTSKPPATVAPPPPAPPPPAEPFPAALRGVDVEVIPGAGRAVALTFDAGANSAGLPSILRTLAAAGVRATFFLTGTWASANPAGVASITAAGHRVGNHSMTHPGFTSLSDAQIAAQLADARAAISAGGAEPRPLFRFPFGERDARTIAAVNALGYVPVRWTVDTLGWKGTSGGITARIVEDRVLAALQPGEIVLMHIGSNPDDGSTLDADALPRIIDRIRQAGYGFTTLDALLG